MGSRRRFDRADVIVLALLAVLGIVLGVMVTSVPRAPGAIEDDGIYLVTARSLAEGRGYRHLELPGSPWQTKYPVLYPFVLSLVWRAAPTFPENVAIMQWVGVLFSCTAAWLTFRLARRGFGFPTALSALSALAFLVNPWTVDMMRMTMAEPLFTALTLAAALVATTRIAARNDGAESSRAWRWAIVAGSAAGLACLTRSIGVTAIAALVIGSALHRRWRAAVLLALVGGAFVVGWSEWRDWASLQNAKIPGTSALGYDLDYGIQIPRDAAELWQVFRHNVVTSAFVLLHMLGRPSAQWVGRAIESGAVLYAAIGATLALCSLGLLTIARGARTFTLLYVGLTVGLVLVWPYEPERFFYPLLPFATIALLRGAQCAWSFVLTRVRREPFAAVRSGTAFATACGVLLCTHYLRADAEMVGAPYHAALAQKREAVARFIDHNTPPHAVIAGYQGAYYAMVTGRKFVPFVPSESPVDFFYPRDRKLLDFGKKMTPLKLRAFDELVSVRAPKYYREAGVSHALTTLDSGGEGFAAKQWSRRKSPLRATAQAGELRLYTLSP